MKLLSLLFTAHLFVSYLITGHMVPPASPPAQPPSPQPDIKTFQPVDPGDYLQYLPGTWTIDGGGNYPKSERYLLLEDGTFAYANIDAEITLATIFFAGQWWIEDNSVCMSVGYVRQWAGDDDAQDDDSFPYKQMLTYTVPSASPVMQGILLAGDGDGEEGPPQLWLDLTADDGDLLVKNAVDMEDMQKFLELCAAIVIPPEDYPYYLAGTWREAEEDSTRYWLQDEGTFIFAESQDDTTSRLRYSTGYWWVEGEELCLSATHLLWWEGGHETQSGLDGYQEELLAIPPADREVERYPILSIPEDERQGWPVRIDFDGHFTVKQRIITDDMEKFLQRCLGQEG